MIGSFTGVRKGPLLICLAGIHGNEPAGMQALRLVFTLLEREPIVNPGFAFAGKMIGLTGNLQASARRCRFIDKDLNRLWTPDHVDRIKTSPPGQLCNEDREMYDLLQIIDTEIRAYEPTEVVILDLHTTSVTGGIFSVVTDAPRSTEIALRLHAPVIRGMLTGLKGTTLHYFSGSRLGFPITPLAFESGQHDDPLSINRAISAIINCLRTIKCVRPEDVENKHDQLLIDFSEGLPKLSELVMVHRVRPDDEFEMLPGYNNFQKISKGDNLAADKRGSISAPADGLILMPLYQKQGEDGFFIIREIAPANAPTARNPTGL